MTTSKLGLMLGIALISRGLRRSGVRRFLYTAVGAGMVWRGLFGKQAAPGQRYPRLERGVPQMETAPETAACLWVPVRVPPLHVDPEPTDELVDVMSEQSFPASDPPAY